MKVAEESQKLLSLMANDDPTTVQEAVSEEEATAGHSPKNNHDENHKLPPEPELACRNAHLEQSQSQQQPVQPTPQENHTETAAPPTSPRQEPKKQEQDQQQPAVEQTAKGNINPGDDKHPDKPELACSTAHLEQFQSQPQPVEPTPREKHTETAAPTSPQQEPKKQEQDQQQPAVEQTAKGNINPGDDKHPDKPELACRTAHLEQSQSQQQPGQPTPREKHTETAAPTSPQQEPKKQEQDQQQPAVEQTAKGNINPGDDKHPDKPELACSTAHSEQFQSQQQPVQPTPQENHTETAAPPTSPQQEPKKQEQDQQQPAVEQTAKGNINPGDDKHPGKPELACRTAHLEQSQSQQQPVEPTPREKHTETAAPTSPRQEPKKQEQDQQQPAVEQTAKGNINPGDDKHPDKSELACRTAHLEQSQSQQQPVQPTPHEKRTETAAPTSPRQEPKKQEQDQQQPAVEQTAKGNINPGDDKHPDKPELACSTAHLEQFQSQQQPVQPTPQENHTETAAPPTSPQQEPKKQEQDQQQPAVEQTAKGNINPGDDKHPDKPELACRTAHLEQSQSQQQPVEPTSHEKRTETAAPTSPQQEPKKQQQDQQQPAAARKRQSAEISNDQQDQKQPPNPTQARAKRRSLWPEYTIKVTPPGVNARAEVKQEIFSSPEPSQHVKVEVKEEILSSPQTPQPSELTRRRQGSRNQHAELKVSAPPEPEIKALFQGGAKSPTPHVEDVCLFGDLLDAESACAGKTDKDTELDQNLTRRFKRIATSRQSHQQQQQQYAKHGLDSDIHGSQRPWKLAKLRPHSQHNKSPASATTASPDSLDKQVNCIILLESTWDKLAAGQSTTMFRSYSLRTTPLQFHVLFRGDGSFTSYVGRMTVRKVEAVTSTRTVKEFENNPHEVKFWCDKVKNEKDIFIWEISKVEAWDEAKPIRFLQAKYRNRHFQVPKRQLMEGSAGMETPRPSLYARSSWFVRLLSIPQYQHLKRVALELDGTDLRIGTTCSGSDICIVAIHGLMEAINAEFGVSWSQFIYVICHHKNTHIYSIWYIYIYISVF